MYFLGNCECKEMFNLKDFRRYLGEQGKICKSNLGSNKLE